MATLYRRGRSWYLQWSEGGHQHRRSLGPIPHSEAERARKVKETELETGLQILTDAPPFDAYAREYLDWYKYEYPSSYNRTREIVEGHLITELGGMEMDRIDPRLVEAYKARRQAAGVKASTVAKEVRTLKAMFARAEEWGVIEAHPFPHVKAPTSTDSRPPRFYTTEELQALYKAKPGKRWVWQLMANTGIRRGEALMLRREWDQGDTLRILSEGSERTKSGKWREVPVSPGAREALDQLKAQTDGERLLPPMNPRSLSRAFRETVTKAGLDGNLHCLRHTFCSHLVMQGVPLRTVQLLAGHSSYSVTEQYAHLAPDHLNSALQGLNL